MNSSLILVKSSPYNGRKSHEILEALMSLALFEVEHSVVFFGEGLLWLAQQQETDNQKSLIKQLKALPIFGSDDIYYCSEHLNEFNRALIIDEIAEPVNLDAVSSWLQAASKVEVF